MNKEILRLQKIAGLLTESQNEPLKIGDRIVVTYKNEYQGYLGTIEDVSGGFVIVNLDDTDGKVSMHSSDVKKIDDMEAEYDDDANWYRDEDDFGSGDPDDGYGPRMQEDEINEAAYVPENVAKFAKKKGVTALVNKVASWAEKAGKGITGGTAIGKNYDTLILDLRHQDGAIYIDISEGTIELYGEPVNSAKSFAKALEANDQSKKD
jgi:hypothetical protein